MCTVSPKEQASPPISQVICTARLGHSEKWGIRAPADGESSPQGAKLSGQ
jgi:hypothetical protein